MTGTDWLGIAVVVAFIWCVIGVAISPLHATFDTAYDSGSPPVAHRGRWWSR